MYYCSNCGSPVSGKGICAHCGAYLKDTAEGSWDGMSAAQKDYERAVRYNKDRESREKQRNNKTSQIYKYGYMPMIGYAPTIVMAAISFVGLVLAFVFSLLYLIMFGVALILSFCLFLLHLSEGASEIYGISYTGGGKNINLLASQALWLGRYARLIFILGVLGAVGTGTQGPITAATIASISAVIGGLLLTIAVSILAKKKFK